MMSNRKIIACGIVVGLAALTWGQSPRAAIKAPGCAELVTFGQEIDMKQAVPLNQAQGRLWLPAIYMGPRAEQVFGQPTLAWSQDDVAAAVKLVGDCGNAAKKAKKTADAQALNAVWQSLAHVRSTLGAVTMTEQKLDQRLKTLLEAEPSRPTLVALMAVAAVREGSSQSLEKAAKALKDHSVQISAWHPVHSQAQYTLDLLRDAPTKSWQPIFPPIDKRIVEVRQWVIDDAKAAINATPESPEGLKAIAPALARTKVELANWLPEAELATLDKTAEARRTAIEDGLVAKETARIDAVPANADGLNQLRMAQASPIKGALSPARAAALDGKIAARREEVGKAVTDEQINRLDQFPNTMAGLRELDAFKNNTGRGLEALAGADAATRFREAATKRATKIGEDAFPAFRKAIVDLPATEEGLGEFEAALEQIKGLVGSLDANVRSRYLDAASKRREEIVAAVAKEDARLAKLPLQGAVFIDPGAGAKLEFSDRTRVYITMFRDQTVEGEYEADGDKIIIRTPRSNDVFKRDGAWLRGAMLNLKRQPER